MKINKGLQKKKRLGEMTLAETKSMPLAMRNDVLNKSTIGDLNAYQKRNNLSDDQMCQVIDGYLSRRRVTYPVFKPV